MRKLLEKLGGIGWKTPEIPHYELETPEAGMCEHGLYFDEPCADCTPNLHRMANKEEIYAAANMEMPGGLDKAYSDGYNAGVFIATGLSVLFDPSSLSAAAKESYRMGILDAFGDNNYDLEKESEIWDDEWIDTFR